jgi:hypothetical protein
MWGRVGVTTSAMSTADVTPSSAVVYGHAMDVYGDHAVWNGEGHRQRVARGGRCHIHRRGRTPATHRERHARSLARVVGAHASGVVQHPSGCAKGRSHDLERNWVHEGAHSALANVHRKRPRLVTQAISGRCATESWAIVPSAVAAEVDGGVHRGSKAVVTEIRATLTSSAPSDQRFPRGSATAEGTPANVSGSGDVR